MPRRIAAAVTAVTAALTLGVGAAVTFHGAATTTPAAADAGNLVRNPGFETGTSSWKTTGSPDGLLLRVAGGHSGSYAARTGTRVASTVVLNDDPNTVASTTAGATYAATAWLRTWADRPLTLRLREVPATGQTLDTAATTVTAPDGQWHQLTLTYVAQRDGSMLDLSVIGQDFPAGQWFLTDDVALTVTQPYTVSSTLVPSRGLWFGVAPNPLHGESWDQALVDFEATIGRRVGIAHYYHRGTQLFPTAIEVQRADEGRLLLENWRPENGNTWAAVSRGASDPLIDQLAAHITSTFVRPFFLAIHGEPEDEVNATAGSGYTAADFAAMYRHVITRLRADGATNVVSVLDLTGNPKWGAQSWFGQLYPGGDVVDWLAEDPYVIGPPGGWYDTDYARTVDRTFPTYTSWPGFYSWAGQVAPDKPIMLAEWGIDDPAGYPSWKPNRVAQFAATLATSYPRVKALVYWNSGAFNPVGTTRVDSSAASLDAFRRLTAAPILNPALP
jgi:hypothetical protein